MSIQLKVNRLLESLNNSDNLLNVLDLPQVNKIGANPEDVKGFKLWFKLVDTNAFCNAFCGMYSQSNYKFTTVERCLRRRKAELQARVDFELNDIDLVIKNIA